MARSLFQPADVSGGHEGDVVTVIVGDPTGAGPESADWSYQTADLETVDGDPISNGQVRLRTGGTTPRFYGPDGVTELKVLRNRAVAATLTGDADPLSGQGGGSQGALDHLSAQYQWTAVDPEYTTLDFAAATITGTPVVVGTGVTADAAAAPQLSLGTWLISTWCQIPGADADRYFEFSNNASDSLSSSAQWGKAGAMSGTPALLVVTEPLDLYLDVEHALGAAANVNFRLIAVKIA